MKMKIEGKIEEINNCESIINLSGNENAMERDGQRNDT